MIIEVLPLLLDNALPMRLVVASAPLAARIQMGLSIPAVPLPLVSDTTRTPAPVVAVCRTRGQVRMGTVFASARSHYEIVHSNPHLCRPPRAGPCWRIILRIESRAQKREPGSRPKDSLMAPLRQEEYRQLASYRKEPHPIPPPSAESIQLLKKSSCGLFTNRSQSLPAARGATSGRLQRALGTHRKRSFLGRLKAQSAPVAEGLDWPRRSATKDL